MQQRQQLPLVFMYALDLHIKHRIDINFDSDQVTDGVGQTLLVGKFDIAEAMPDARIVNSPFEAFEFLQIIFPCTAQMFSDEL